MPDAHAPRDIARKVESLGVTKARTDALTMLVLSILAGAFISMGALFYTVVITGSQLGFGPTRLLGGLCFSLGLVLVIVAGAELFTGNNLIAMAWASRLVTTRELARNWVVVYAGNILGAVATVELVRWAGVAALSGGAVGETAIQIGRAKAALDPGVTFARGILCNALVCLAVWLAMGGRSVADKVLAIIVPVAAFVAMGFEHSIANWFFLPWAMQIDPSGSISYDAALANIGAATAGNIVGGTFLVAGIYWSAYLRDGTTERRNDGT